MRIVLLVKVLNKVWSRVSFFLKHELDTAGLVQCPLMQVDEIVKVQRLGSTPGFRILGNGISQRQEVGCKAFTKYLD